MEYECYSKDCPMNEKSKILSKNHVCTSSLEIWSRCLRYTSFWSTDAGKKQKEANKRLEDLTKKIEEKKV